MPIASVVLILLASSSALADGRPYRIRVVDEFGRPVRGAEIEAECDGERSVSARSDAAGRATVDVGEAGFVQVRARAADGRVGAGLVHSTEGCLEEGCIVEGYDLPIVVAVTASARAAGVVRGPDGRAVTAARVALRWMGTGQGTVLHSAFSDEVGVAATSLRRFRLAADEGAPLDHPMGHPGVASTDTSGHWTLDAPRPGVYAVVVDAPRLASRVSAPHQLLAGRTARVDLTLARGFRLEATVLDEHGDPVMHGVVSIQSADGCESVWRPAAQGSPTVFEGLPLGRYRVWGSFLSAVTVPREVSSQGPDRRASLGGPGGVRQGPAVIDRCTLPPRHEPEAIPPPDVARLCDIGVDLHPIEGRRIVVPFGAVPRGLPLLEGDVVDTIDGRPAPRSYADRCGRRVVIETTRPATGERRRFTVRLTRSADE